MIRRVKAGVSSMVVLAALVSGCGKRGDPLPPLRPVPAVAEAVVVRQVGTAITLEWRAPSRNRDGTTENVDLREVRILRRVIDIEALVEAQTQPLEPSTDVEEEATSTEGGPDTVVDEELPLEPVGETETEPVGETETELVGETEAELVESSETTEGEADLEEASPSIPQRPALEIPPFASAAQVIATLPSTELGETRSYEEEVLPDWVGKRVEYALIYTNGKKRASPLSSIAQIEPVEELEVPEAPVASVGDGWVELRWESDDESDGTHFAVYRRAGGAESYPTRPLNPTPLSAPEFVDDTIVFGRPICYVVRRTIPPEAPSAEEAEPEGTEAEGTEAGETQAEATEPQATEPEATEPQATEPEATEPEATEPEATEPEATEPEATEPEELDEPPEPTELVPVVPPMTSPARITSLPSEEVCLTPEDTFAPPIPTGLAGVSLEDGVLLTWDVVQADDLGGYRLYRASSPGGPFELLNDEILPSASFTDETAEPGRIYYYAVTAVDSTDRINESRRSELAEARRLSP